MSNDERTLNLVLVEWPQGGPVRTGMNVNVEDISWGTDIRYTIDRENAGELYYQLRQALWQRTGARVCARCGHVVEGGREPSDGYYCLACDSPRGWSETNFVDDFRVPDGYANG